MELEECVEDVLKVFWEFAAEILMSLLKYCLKEMKTFTVAVNQIQVYQRISYIYTYARCPLASILVVQPRLSVCLPDASVVSQQVSLENAAFNKIRLSWKYRRGN